MYRGKWRGLDVAVKTVSGGWECEGLLLLALTQYANIRDQGSRIYCRQWPSLQ